MGVLEKNLGIANAGVTLLLFTIGLKLKIKSLIRPEVWAGATDPYCPDHSGARSRNLVSRRGIDAFFPPAELEKACCWWHLH
jgi:hypothetical protein